MKVLALYSNKGGVGKTASAVNLAYWAAHAGHKTLLIDLDPQGASSFYFRVRPSQKNRGKAFFKTHDRLLRQVKASDFENLDVIPAHRSFRRFDTLLGVLNKRTNRLRSLLKELKGEYELVMLDCPPTFGLLSENIFRATDLIMVPMIPTTLAEHSFRQLVHFLKEKDYGRKKLVPFFTMVDVRKRLHKETILRMRKRCRRLLRYTIPYSSDVEKMGLYRAPMDVYAQRSQANLSYRAIWQAVQTILFPETTPTGLPAQGGQSAPSPIDA